MKPNHICLVAVCFIALVNLSCIQNQKDLEESVSADIPIWHTEKPVRHVELDEHLKRKIQNLNFKHANILKIVIANNSITIKEKKGNKNGINNSIVSSVILNALKENYQREISDKTVHVNVAIGTHIEVEVDDNTQRYWGLYSYDLKGKIMNKLHQY